MSVDEQLAAVGAVLVEDRALRRLIKARHGLAGVGSQVPHADCDVLPRAALGAAVPAGAPDMLVAFRGDRAALEAGDAAAWTAAWRRIFHGRIHLAFDSRAGTASLLTPAAVRERVHRIGETEFDEIRVVLREEDLRLPVRGGAVDDDLATYVEFVALYLELKHFAPHEIGRMFPTLDDGRDGHGAGAHAAATSQRARIDATIALDVDDLSLLAQTRPAPAPERVEHAAAVPTAAGTRTLRAIRDASARPAAAAARTRGNRAWAAILALRAGDDDAARADLDALCEALATALGAAREASWTDALLPVARYAAAQRVIRFTAGARLLHDLQSAVVDGAREDRVVDVATWALSLGKQPVVRALPATREIRIAKHLHAANKKIAEAGLVSSDERERLAAAVHDLVEHADQQVRRVLRPKLEAALDEVDLRPTNLPERVAQKKLVDELLDQAVAVGRLSLPNLRDALSHNDLKMKDLRPSQLTHGDQLLRADKILSTSLDGVYHRGEVYLRGLQKASSMLFGVPIGRFLSRYLLLPVIAAYVCVLGAVHLGLALVHLLTGEKHELEIDWWVYVPVAVIVFLLLHARPARVVAQWLLRGVGRGLRFAFVDVPRALWALPITRKFSLSWPARFVVKPAIPAAVIALLFPTPAGFILAAAVFAMVAFSTNTRQGRLAQEVVADSVVVGTRHVSRHLVPGVVRLIIDVFEKLLELFDRGIYRVDAFFRFRAGQSRVKVALKAVFGTLWFVLTYLLRMFVTLMLEPVVNPVKHFPIVTVAAKLMLPFAQGIVAAIEAALSPAIGVAMAGAVAAFAVFMIPGIAGFLVWELKENWKLYQATRPAALEAVAFGHHGETMTAMLRPGFHSGTIPKLYAKLRRAARKGDESAVAKHKEALHHVAEAVWKFAERELVAMLDEAAAFRARDVAVARVDLASNRVQIVLVAPSVSLEPAMIAFEEQSGWLLASLPVRGWIAALPADQRHIFEIALAGFYKLADVTVVREQLEHVLRGAGGRVPAYDVSREGLVAWPGPGYTSEIVYDLKARTPAPAVRGDALAGLEAPILEGRRALFGREDVGWLAWTTAWQVVAAGGEAPGVLAGPSLVP